jgi:hypothetical protein
LGGYSACARSCPRFRSPGRDRSGDHANPARSR